MYRKIIHEKDLKIISLVHAAKESEATKSIAINVGQGIDDVQERQRRRKMAALREGCEKALWFTGSYNVDLIKVVFQSRKTGEPIDVYKKGTRTCTNSITQLQDDSSQLLQLQQTLQLLDRFAVSDEFYREISMLNPSLPRLHNVKALRASLNQDIKLDQLPKPYFGCYRKQGYIYKNTMS